jgi:hypothetical protein
MNHMQTGDWNRAGREDGEEIIARKGNIYLNPPPQTHPLSSLGIEDSVTVT